MGLLMWKSGCCLELCGLPVPPDSPVPPSVCPSSELRLQSSTWPQRSRDQGCEELQLRTWFTGSVTRRAVLAAPHQASARSLWGTTSHQLNWTISPRPGVKSQGRQRRNRQRSGKSSSALAQPLPSPRVSGDLLKAPLLSSPILLLTHCCGPFSAVFSFLFQAQPWASLAFMLTLPGLADLHSLGPL